MEPSLVEGAHEPVAAGFAYFVHVCYQLLKLRLDLLLPVSLCAFGKELSDLLLVGTIGFPHHVFPHSLRIKFFKEGVALEKVVHIYQFPVSEVDSVGVEESLAVVVNESELRRGLKRALEDGDVTACIVSAIQLLPILSLKQTDVLEADGDAKELSQLLGHHFFFHFVHVFSYLCFQVKAAHALLH